MAPDYRAVAKLLRLVLAEASTNEQRDNLIAAALGTAWTAGFEAAWNAPSVVSNTIPKVNL